MHVKKQYQNDPSFTPYNLKFNMKIIRHQLSFFTPSAAYGNMSKVLSLLLSKCEGVLDAPPTSLPVPPEAPPEIPRIIFKSERGDKELTLRLDRIDSVFFRSYDEAITDDEIKKFQKDTLGWVSPLLDSFGIQVNRLGVVFQRAMVVDDSAATYLAQKFCRKEYMTQPFGNSQRFEIHNLKNYKS